MTSVLMLVICWAMNQTVLRRPDLVSYVTKDGYWYLTFADKDTMVTNATCLVTRAEPK
jgi:hypothetical protein